MPVAAKHSMFDGQSHVSLAIQHANQFLLADVVSKLVTMLLQALTLRPAGAGQTAFMAASMASSNARACCHLAVVNLHSLYTKEIQAPAFAKLCCFFQGKT